MESIGNFFSFLWVDIFPCSSSNPADLNSDSKVDGWDDFLWFSFRRLWDVLTPPFTPHPPGYGDDGPGSSEQLINSSFVPQT